MLHFLKESITGEDFNDLKEDEGHKNCNTEHLFDRLCSFPKSDIECLFEKHFPTENDPKYFKFKSYENIPQVGNIYRRGST